MTVLQILLVGAGSALGGMARFVLSQVFRTGGRFPWATLAVNVVGSLAFGILAGWLVKAGSGEWARSVRLFAIVGICGGFTTFSTFSNETFELFRSGQGLLAAAYALVSLAGGLPAVSLGYWISR